MTRDEAMGILYRHGMIARYWGPGYRSWHAVQDYMARHPRGRGLRPGGRTLYDACLIYQQERSRTRAWKPIPRKTDDDRGTPPAPEQGPAPGAL